MSEKNTYKEALAMTADTVGRDLLQALVQEIKLLPDVWAKLPKAKQDDVIDRLRERVETKVTMAVHLIAADGRVAIAAEFEQVTVKDGVKAVFIVSKHDPNLHAFIDAQGISVLICVANPADHLGGMKDIKGESDQRAMDLGHEYDPDSDGKGMDDTGTDSNVVDAQVKTIGRQILQSELETAYGDGKLAAQEGRPQSDCPIMDGDLCIEWIKGWKAWHEENPADAEETAAT